MNAHGGLISNNNSEEVWEGMWAPYDEPTYQAVLESIYPPDVILEIGAGDLRLARRAAALARKVYAIETQPALLDQALALGPLPGNIDIMCADARDLPFPEGVTCGILLMRHCTHFQFYADKLKALGAQRLITNARWGLGVETVWLQVPRSSYEQMDFGWYACWCGGVGFKPGPVERLTPEAEARVHEVRGCPECVSKV